MSKFFGHPICYGAPTGHYGPEGDTNFVNFGEAIEFGGNSTGGIQLFILDVVETSCLFDVPECLY